MPEPAAPAAEAPAPAAAPATAPPAVPTFDASRSEVTTGRLVALTFGVWFRGLHQLAVVGVLTLLLPLLGSAALGLFFAFRRSRWGVRNDPAFFGFAMLALLVAWAVVLGGGLTQGVLQRLSGQRARIPSMLWTSLRSAVPLLTTFVLVSLAVVGGLLLLIVPGLVVGAGLGLALPVVVAERCGPIRALRRSWTLSRDHRLAIFLGAFVVGLVQLLMTTSVGFLVQVVERRMPVVSGLAAIGWMVLVVPLPALFPAVAYHELRVAKEGAATSDILSVFE